MPSSQVEQYHKVIHKKWVIQILFLLYSGKQISYKKIKELASIPNATLTTRVNELTKYGYMQRFVYGSKTKPHYTEYCISETGKKYIDDLLEYMNN